MVWRSHQHMQLGSQETHQPEAAASAEALLPLLPVLPVESAPCSGWCAAAPQKRAHNAGSSLRTPLHVQSITLVTTLSAAARMCAYVCRAAGVQRPPQPVPAPATDALHTGQVLGRSASPFADRDDGERHWAEGSREMLDICLAPTGDINAPRHACSLSEQPVAPHYCTAMITEFDAC
jgi:hypothetical protein